MNWPDFIAGFAFGGLFCVIFVIWVAMHYSGKE